jgi:PAS domain-containing protein
VLDTAAHVADLGRGLKEVAEWWRALLDAAPDALVVVDEAGRIRLTNAAASNLFGYSAAELLGAPVETLVPLRSVSGTPEFGRTAWLIHMRGRWGRGSSSRPAATTGRKFRWRCPWPRSSEPSTVRDCGGARCQ